MICLACKSKIKISDVVVTCSTGDICRGCAAAGWNFDPDYKLKLFPVRQQPPATIRLRLCLLRSDGSIPLDRLPISPAAAAKREPAAWLELYEEMRLVYLREFAQGRMVLERGR